MLTTFTESSLRDAARIVERGGLVAFPTETFYGLGVRPLDAPAVRRIFEVKGRSSNPILVLVRSRADLDSLVAEVTPDAERLMERCWPGPLTLVFRAAAAVPGVLTAGTGTIGIRLSASADVRRLLEAAEGPLTGTSANRSGEQPAATAQDVERTIGSGVDLILDGGATPGGLASTVVDTTVTPPRLIREGRVRRDALLAVLESLAA